MTPTQTPATFTLRLTPEDRARLERDAGYMPLGAYVRWRLFDPANPQPRSRRRPRGGDVAALTALLAKLGQSQIPNNLNQLAKLAHSGSLVLTPETEADIHQMAADIAAMRAMLIEAIGLRDGAP